MAQQEESALSIFEGLKVSTNNSEFPRFAYLGAGAKIDLMEEWLQFLRKLKIGASSTYIDLTAGSCNQPYTIQKQLGSRIITNDAVPSSSRGSPMRSIFSAVAQVGGGSASAIFKQRSRV